MDEALHSASYSKEGFKKKWRMKHSCSYRVLGGSILGWSENGIKNVWNTDTADFLVEKEWAVLHWLPNYSKTGTSFGKENPLKMGENTVGGSQQSIVAPRGPQVLAVGGSPNPHGL